MSDESAADVLQATTGDPPTEAAAWLVEELRAVAGDALRTVACGHFEEKEFRALYFDPAIIAEYSPEGVREIQGDVVLEPIERSEVDYARRTTGRSVPGGSPSRPSARRTSTSPSANSKSRPGCSRTART